MISIPAAPGYTSTSGEPGAAASGDKLQNDMEGIDANFDELDERTQNQSTDGTKTDFQGKITGTEVAVATVSVTSGGKIQHDGTPVAGYLVDGTPFFFKRVSVTIADAATAGSASHGITNAYTNARIIDFGFIRDSGAVMIKFYADR